MTHYHVGHNMPGYLPESDVYYAPTKTFAVAILKEEKRHVLDSDYEGELTFEGDAVKDMGYNMYRNGELREVFWISQCSDESCAGFAKDQHWY